MSQHPAGAYSCDRCGRELQNGGLSECAIIIDLDERSGAPVRYHLCRDWMDDGGRLVRGCVTRVLTRGALAANPPARNKDSLSGERRKPGGTRRPQPRDNIDGRWLSPDD